MTRPAAIVIGIGPGLGQALVRAFANAGFSVAFVGRRRDAVLAHERDMRAEGLDVAGFVGDAGKPEIMDRVYGAIADRFGRAEVLIYNAAIIEPARFVTPSGLAQAQYGDAAGWDARGATADPAYLVDTFRTNVAGAHHAASRVAPDMIAQGKGSILLTGGVLAFEPWIEWGVTSLGKAALRSMGHSLFKELQPHGVQATTIAIHGTMQAGTPYDHDDIARAYLDLHLRPQEEWTPDYHFKKGAQDDGDPDA
ncbi:SDR family NAD(P)-dependent oxidoreductase [Marivita sp. S2033]|uniref:SDR family NAD(P)-dependent oxidoreductase n=1 Tax=Marivita sp. S2033 TaxID=3373187 RepID=UPI00398290BF